MAAKTKEETKTADDGFTKLATQDSAPAFEQSEWVEPGKGTVIEGELTAAFVVPDDMGNNKRKPYRACYTVRDEKGDLWNFGEKSAFADSIRKLRVGAWIRLTFQGKEPVIVNGKPTGRTIWRVTLERRNDGNGQTMLEALKSDHAAKLKSGEDLPF